MRKTLILFFFKGIGALSSLILGMLISKYFGLAVLGEYGVIFSYILFFSIIATWGSNIYVVEHQKNKVDFSYFLFWLVFSLVVSLVAIVFFKSKFDLFYMGIVVFVYSFLSHKSSYFMLSGYQYYNTLLDDLLKYIFPIMFLFFMKDYLHYFDLFVISQIFLLLISFFIFYKLMVFDKKNSSSWRDNFFYGVMPTISALLVLLNAQFDRIILSYTVSKEMLGIYYAAQTVMALVSYITVSVMMVITPNLIKSYKERNLVKIRELSKKYSIFIILISSFIFLLAVFFGDIFFKLYSINSVEGYWALLVLLFGITVSQIFGFGMTIYTYTENKKKLIYYQLINFIIASTLCFILSNLYGIVGAAISTAFGLILIKVMIWQDFRKKGIRLGII